MVKRPKGGEQAGAVEFELDDRQHIGTAVVRAVSEAVGTPVTEIDVELNDIVDPDALNRLFAPRYDGTPRHGGRVIFEMSNCEVTVFESGRVRAVPLGE
jgi:hypothetical protein